MKILLKGVDGILNKQSKGTTREENKLTYYPPAKINKKWQDINILLLAYLGDGVYELWVRQHLIEQGLAKVDEIHKKTINYVQAKTQAAILKELMADLDETETSVVLRGRNAKGHYPRNVSVVTYRHATAFEALVGYWYLTGNLERMNDIFSRIDDILGKLPAGNIDS